MDRASPPIRSVPMSHLLRILFVVLLAAFACALLVRYSPGALVDERELNQKLSEASLTQLRDQQASEQSIARGFLNYLHGDLGYSRSNNATVASLIRDRAPATLRELAIGLTGAWLAGFVFAIPGVRRKGGFVYDGISATVAGLLLSLPAALLAYISVFTGTPAGFVLVAALAPRIFRFCRNLLRQAYGASHVAMARATGVPESRIFTAHVIPSIAPQLLALGATSVAMAIGATIPIEAICGTPGIGRLAWQAATARDLPLLVNLTMLIAIVTTFALGVSESLAEKQS